MVDNYFCRAKDKMGYWRYGYYVRHEVRQPCVIGDELKEDEIEHYIFFDSFADWNMPRQLQYVEIDPKTLGRFTGMYDKNKKKIFEGDIVMKRVYEGKRPCKVVFSRGCFNCGWGGGSSTAGHPYLLDDKNIEVIGNVVDNPELLKEYT